MEPTESGRRDGGHPRDSVLSIILGASLLQGANGLLQAILPLRMQLIGFASTEIGLVAAAYGGGFFVGCLFASRFVGAFGFIRAFASLAALTGVIVMAFPLATDVLSWMMLRALSGATLAGLFTVGDSWVSAQARSDNRGRILGIYMIGARTALILSPFLVGVAPVGGDRLFMAVNVLLCVALLPVAFTLGETPAPPRLTALRLGELYEIAPSSIVGGFVIGLSVSPVIALAPVYGVQSGLRPDQAAGLLIALQVGGFLMQWPLGWLSDRMDRRRVIAGIAVGTVAMSLLLTLLPARPAPALLFLGFFAWGALALCAYALCVAHASDLVPRDRVVPTISGILLTWATGSMIGPVPAAAALDLVGPWGLFLYQALAMAGLAVFVVHRVVRMPRPPGPGPFVDLPPTSPATGTMAPRAAAPSEES